MVAQVLTEKVVHSTGGLCRNAPQRKSKAVKRSLADIELRRLGKGRYLLPLLDPVRDGLPFAMALELQAERGGGTLPASWGDTKAERRLFSLRYILDSTSQVRHLPLLCAALVGLNFTLACVCHRLCWVRYMARQRTSVQVNCVYSCRW